MYTHEHTQVHTHKKVHKNVQSSLVHKQLQIEKPQIFIDHRIAE